MFHVITATIGFHIDGLEDKFEVEFPYAKLKKVEHKGIIKYGGGERATLNWYVDDKVYTWSCYGEIYRTSETAFHFQAVDMDGDSGVIYIEPFVVEDMYGGLSAEWSIVMSYKKGFLVFNCVKENKL